VLITADQLLAHAFGDYILQSDWMARNKVSNVGIAFIHAACYVIPFLFLSPSPQALAVMVVTHAIIDRFAIAGWVSWVKNGMPTPRTSTGFPQARPEYLVTWLVIVSDNILHVTVNGMALKWL
jgi:hypothetical protein